MKLLFCLLFLELFPLSGRAQKLDTAVVFKVTEVYPTPVNGWEAVQRYIRENINRFTETPAPQKNEELVLLFKFCRDKKATVIYPDKVVVIRGMSDEFNKGFTKLLRDKQSGGWTWGVPGKKPSQKKIKIIFSVNPEKKE